MNTLLWILLIAIGGWWLFRIMSRTGGGGGSGHAMAGGGCCGGHSHGSHDKAHKKHGASHLHSGGRQISEMVVDPVCNMAVDRDKAAHTLSYGGTSYYFCSGDCYEKFKNDPEGYLLKQPELTR
jgi:YHS domain-containing protein